MSRLKDLYQKEVVSGLTKDLGLENVMQCPRVTKVVVNIGVGDAIDNGKLLDESVRLALKVLELPPESDFPFIPSGELPLELLSHLLLVRLGRSQLFQGSIVGAFLNASREE